MKDAPINLPHENAMDLPPIPRADVGGLYSNEAMHKYARAAVRADRAARPPAGLEQDAKRLLQFAAWVVAEQRDSLGDIYGGDVQDKMQELGILHKVEVTEPCCEELCRCVEYGDFPMDCLRLAFDVDAIAAAPSPTGEKG